MVKSLVVKVAVLVFLVSLPAAACASASVLLGIKGGLSLSSPSRSGGLNPGVEWSTRTGFALAAMVEIPIARRFSLLLEPSIVQKGMRVDWPTEASDFDNTTELTYLDIPLSLNMRFPSGSLEPFVFVGPYFGIALSRRVEFDNGFPSRDAAHIQPYDAGITLGAGVRAPVGHAASILLDGRYAVGMVDISETAYSSIKNRSFMILVGLEFGR